MIPACDLPPEDLVAYADGALHAARKELVAAHLQVCPDCRQRMAEFTAVDRLLQAHTPLIHDRAQQQALVVRIEQVAGRQRRPPSTLWMAIVVCVLVLLLVMLPPITRLAWPTAPHARSRLMTQSSIVYLRHRAFFVANDGMHGDELWESDGTPAGTILIKDIHPGSSGSRITDLVTVNDKLLFVADDGVRGPGVWVSDGTATGTIMVEPRSGT